MNESLSSSINHPVDWTGIRHQLSGLIPMTLRPPPPRSAILEDWSYNIFTKERQLPEAMITTGNAIQQINEAFYHLKQFHVLLSGVDIMLKPPNLMNVEQTVHNCLQSRDDILQMLEVNVNAMKLYWFPETVDQLQVGAYQSVRADPIEFRLKAVPQELTCAICQEIMGRDGVVPIIFIRRCKLNPLLHLKCDEQVCKCLHPTLCLKCGLNHLLQNAILEGRSSTKCPSCRGEVCIYDLQEVFIYEDKSVQ